MPEDSLPDFVSWSVFPFEGELQIKPPLERLPADLPRGGEEGGTPCTACADDDDAYLWTNDRWRVRAGARKAAPFVFLETRDHLDLDDFDDDLAADFGRMTVALNRAMLAAGDYGRVHVNRWGDGGSHFHVWFFARPRGDRNMLGFGMPMWAEILPPMDKAAWNETMAAIGAALGRAT
jgi:hypothetical protein